MPFTRLRAVLVLGLIALTARGQNAQKVYARVAPSVVTLEVVNLDGSKTIGTAFLALREGVAVTAWHVVDTASIVRARFADGREVPVTGLIDVDKANDIAIVGIATRGRPLLPLETNSPPIGARTFVIGAAEGLESSISEGILSGIRALEGSRRYQYTAPTSAGNSGGPVLNASGSVIGVVSFSLANTQGLNFAIPTYYVKQLNARRVVRSWRSAAIDELLSGDEYPRTQIKGYGLPLWVHRLRPATGTAFVEDSPGAMDRYRVSRPRLFPRDFILNKMTRPWEFGIDEAVPSEFIRVATRLDGENGWKLYRLTFPEGEFFVDARDVSRTERIEMFYKVDAKTVQAAWAQLAGEMRRRLGLPRSSKIIGSISYREHWEWRSGYTVDLFLWGDEVKRGEFLFGFWLRRTADTDF